MTLHPSISILLTGFASPFQVALLAFGLLGMAAPVLAEDSADGAPMIRLVCVAALPGHQHYILASRQGDNRWKEHHALQLRSSQITPWLEAPTEKLFLCVEKNQALIEKASIVIPEGARRLLVILLPAGDKASYTTEVIDTDKVKYGKGETLIVNASTMAADVALGGKAVEIAGGASSVRKASANANGMFRLVVSYTDDSGESVICSDRYMRINDTGRDLLILTPDPNSVLQVNSLSDFGPFE